MGVSEHSETLETKKVSYKRSDRKPVGETMLDSGDVGLHKKKGFGCFDKGAWGNRDEIAPRGGRGEDEVFQDN